MGCGGSKASKSQAAPANNTLLEENKAEKQAAAGPTYELTYFGITGLGEPIRATMALAGIPFVDTCLTGEQWAAVKTDQASPLFEKQLPGLTITAEDGTKETLSQARAILRYIGTIGKYDGKPLYSKDPMEAYNCDVVIDMVEDIRPLMVATFSITDLAEKEKARADLVKPEGKMYAGLTKIDARLGNFAFAAGDSPSIADAYVICVCYMFQAPTFLDGFPADTLKDFPNIVALKNKYMGLPPLVAYYKDATGHRSPFQVDPPSMELKAEEVKPVAEAAPVEEAAAVAVPVPETSPDPVQESAPEAATQDANEAPVEVLEEQKKTGGFFCCA